MARRAEEQLAQRCAELGIPEKFRPGFHTYWSGRGENGLRERRTELRRVAQSRLDADARRAKLQIDVAAQELQEKLVVGALESAEAKGFLEAMPMPETMMAALSLSALEASLWNQPAGHKGGRGRESERMVMTADRPEMYRMSGVLNLCAGHAHGLEFRIAIAVPACEIIGSCTPDADPLRWQIEGVGSSTGPFPLRTSTIDLYEIIALDLHIPVMFKFSWDVTDEEDARIYALLLAAKAYHASVAEAYEEHLQTSRMNAVKSRLPAQPNCPTMLHGSGTDEGCECPRARKGAGAGGKS